MGHTPRDLDPTALNPATRASPTYHEVCTAILTTKAEIERHEERIYQVGYTPSAIRNRVNTMLRNSSADQPILEFQAKDIPPPNRDAHTHRVLTDILKLRNQMDEDFNLTPDLVASDGSAITNPQAFEAAYVQRDQEYHRLNRSMYQVVYFVH